ncbi:hypothetical protein [Chryseobacterium vrystaatense]|uniref:Bacteriophage holin family protein n=1 Tax=Chryseobacterium vrystaatense TaxID=307480 RepID=A0ABR4UJ43_9FLAO|nr:hypothetical protein [Chryseobacterium vrystaatense]KFF24749.1 hypothetical protein IW16_17595 [Chryseobacterium vrystaatense]
MPEKEIKIVITDGLLNWPYSSNDWIIIVLAISAYFFRMYLIYKNIDSKNPKVIDWIGIFVLTILSTISLYEMALHYQWPLKVFFLPFALSVILAKDLSDWLFMTKDGKDFVIHTFKEILSGVLKNFGYIKQNKNSDNEENNTTDV